MNRDTSGRKRWKEKRMNEQIERAINVGTGS